MSKKDENVRKSVAVEWLRKSWLVITQASVYILCILGSYPFQVMKKKINLIVVGFLLHIIVSEA